jgi:hypothetical protein
MLHSEPENLLPGFECRRRIVFDEAEKVSNIFASFVSTRADGSFFNEVIRALPRGYLLTETAR